MAPGHLEGPHSLVWVRVAQDLRVAWLRCLSHTLHTAPDAARGSLFLKPATAPEAIGLEEGGTAYTSFSVVHSGPSHPKCLNQTQHGV